MRSSIKIISCIVTITIFITLNIILTTTVPYDESLDTKNPTYYIVLVIIMGSILTMVTYFYVQSRQKTKIKL